MKRFLLACLVCACLVALLVLPVSAATQELPDVLGGQSEPNVSVFTKLLDTVKTLATTIFAACASAPVLKHVLRVIACLVLCAIATVGYRFFHIFSVGYNALVGFVFGFSLCSIVGGPQWLLDVAPVMNWIFAVLIMAVAVLGSFFARRLTISATLAISCTTLLAAITPHTLFLAIAFILFFVIFLLAMKSFFIPVSSVASATGVSLILFGPAGAFPLTSVDVTLGLVGGVHSWMIVALVLSVIFIATSTIVSKGTRYY